MHRSATLWNTGSSQIFITQHGQGRVTHGIQDLTYSGLRHRSYERTRQARIRRGANRIARFSYAWSDIDYEEAGVVWDSAPVISIDPPIVIDADSLPPQDEVVVEQRADEAMYAPDIQDSADDPYVPSPGTDTAEHSQQYEERDDTVDSPPSDPPSLYDQSASAGVYDSAGVHTPDPLTIAGRTRQRAPVISNLEYEQIRNRPHYRSRIKQSVALKTLKVKNIPVQRALKDPARAFDAQDAMATEIKQCLDIGIWDPIHWESRKAEEPTLKQPIGSHLFVRDKKNTDGEYTYMKGRLVGGGNQQSRADALPEDITSPTAATPFIMCIASIAAKERRHVITADVPGAYLHADNSKHGITMRLDKVVSAEVVRQDHRYYPYVRGDGTIIVRLKKAIYGCIESARLW
jgi:hypothetical protein